MLETAEQTEPVCTHPLGTVKPGHEVQAVSRVEPEDWLPCARPAVRNGLCAAHVELQQEADATA